jgi:hypothetical protein
VRWVVGLLAGSVAEIDTSYMSAFRDWFWEIKETGQGPNYYFSATFAASDAECLTSLVRQYPLAGFRHCHFVGNLIGAPCGSHDYHGAYDLYVDDSNHAKLASSLKGEKPSITVAHWTWHIIGVCGHELGIDCAYGECHSLQG